MAGPRPYIGGQAVLEGVMMRAPRSFAVVVRRRDGSLLVRERPMGAGPAGVARWPLVRGMVSLVESLRLGGEALRFSVDQMERDMVAAQRAPGTSMLSALGLAISQAIFALATQDDGTSPAAPERGRNLESTDAPASSEGRGSRAATGLMLAVAIGFFVALPQAVA